MASLFNNRKNPNDNAPTDSTRLDELSEGIKIGQELAHKRSIEESNEMEKLSSKELIEENEQSYKNSIDFRADVEQIYYYMTDAIGLTDDDYRYLRRFIELIETTIKVGIFNDVVRHNDNLELILRELSEKIEEYSLEVSKLEEYLNSQLVNSGSARLTRLKKYLSTLENMYNELNNKNYPSLAADLASDMEKGQQLVDNCSVVLAQSFKEYESMFGIPVKASEENEKQGYSINPDVIERLFSIITNHSLHDEIRVAVNKKEEYLNLVKKFKETEGAVAAYQSIRDNYDLIKEYLYNKNKVEQLEKLNEQANDRIVELNGLIVEYSNLSLIEKLRSSTKERNYNLEKEHLNSSISLNEKKIADAKAKLEGLKPKLKENKVERIVERFQQKLSFTQSSTISIFDDELDDEDILAQNSVALFNNQNLDYIDALLVSNMNKIEELKKLIIKKKDDFESYKDSLSAQAMELIQNDYATCYKLIEIEKEDKIDNQTPIICAFILKTIVDSRKISWEEVFNLSGAELNVVELSAYYEDKIEKFIQPYQSQYEESIRNKEVEEQNYKTHL